MFTVYRDFGDSAFLRNVRKFLPDYTALRHRRQYSSVVAVFMAQFQPEISAGHFSKGKKTLLNYFLPNVRRYQVEVSQASSLFFLIIVLLR